MAIKRATNEVRESETLAERKKRKSTGSRGKYAESHFQGELFSRKKKDAHFDYDRLLDSKAAGRIVAAQVADFLLFFGGSVAAVEVKEIKKGFRLPKKSFPQLARIRRRMQTGSLGFLVVYTAESSQWFLVDVGCMEDAVSWELRKGVVSVEFRKVGSLLIEILNRMERW